MSQKTIALHHFHLQQRGPLVLHEQSPIHERAHYAMLSAARDEWHSIRYWVACPIANDANAADGAYVSSDRVEPYGERMLLKDADLAWREPQMPTGLLLLPRSDN